MLMNRLSFLKLIALAPAALAASALTRCQTKDGIKGRSTINSSDRAIGVFETRGNVADSRIIFYDENLNYAGDLRLPYATLGMDFQLPSVRDGYMYVVPQGLMGKCDERLVLGLALDDLSLRKYHVDQIAIYGVACNEEHLYSCSNLNWSSYIGRNALADQSNYKEIELPGMCVNSIIAVRDRLYAFAWRLDSPTRQTLLLAYADDLELVDTVDISICGRGQFRPRVYDDAIYFTSWESAEDDAPGSPILGVFDTERLELNAYDLGDELLDVIPDATGVYALFGSRWAAEGTPTTVGRYDLSSINRKEIVTVDDTLRYAVLRNDKFYAVSDDRIYLMETEGDFGKIRSEGLSTMGGTYSYYSGMFTF